jgi:hypothetical protein
MPRPKRKGATETFSISVTPETRARLREAARRSHGGNVSALIEAIVVEAERQHALDWLLHRAPPVDDAAFEQFMKEMAGPKKRRRRSAA